MNEVNMLGAWVGVIVIVILSIIAILLSRRLERKKKLEIQMLEER